MSKGVIKKVAGPLIIAEGMRDVNMFDVVRASNQRLIGETIEIHGDKASVQIYEEAPGLRLGEPTESIGVSINVEFRPGLIGGIYDDIQRPLDAIMEEIGGNLLSRGIEVPSLKCEKKQTFEPVVAQDDKVDDGDIIGTVQETDVVVQGIMIPVGVQGALIYINSGESAVTNTVAVVTDEKGQEHPMTLMRRQPVCKGRPYQEKLSPDMPLVIGQRAINCLFPIAKGGAVAVPGSLGLGRTMVQHQLAKWAGAGIVVYIGCGRRDSEMTDVLNEFLELKDPKTGRSLMERTILTADTSDIPIAAREISIYTDITIVKYLHNMGYSVALMADSTSRWVKALREMSGHPEEMLGGKGYPAYPGLRLTQLYERVGRVVPLDSDNREDVLSIIGAVSPAGGDISESVTQTTLRIVKVFWSLDADLVYRRYFSVINWLTSYSLYVDTMEKWFNAEVESNWTKLRSHLMCLLQEEPELNEIAQLVGTDILSAPDRLRLEAARFIHENFLHQNVSHEIGIFTSLRRQHMTVKLMIAYYDQSQDTLGKGVNIECLISLPVREVIGRFKYTEGSGLDKVCADVIKIPENEINDELSREESF